MPSNIRANRLRNGGSLWAEGGEHLTEDKSLPKSDRKWLQVETAGKKSREAKLIKLAEKTSNLRAITNSLPPNWSVERRLEYIQWAKHVVANVRGVSPWLEEQFDPAERALRSI